MPILVYPENVRQALTLATTIALGISIAFSTLLGVMVVTKVGYTRSNQHGLSLAMLFFLSLTTVLQTARLIANRKVPTTHPASPKDLSAKALKVLRFCVLGSAGIAYVLALALSILAMLDDCSVHMKHALALSTLVFLVADSRVWLHKRLDREVLEQRGQERCYCCLI